ncbi:hypothetical protein HDV04_001938 [Boothiomyces sp. JEL0838]|nr:hypothetical protein HDV04_001938 [Boothiomyces sp. JEL0838]
MIVSDDGNYRYRYMDIASKYVGEQLWIRYHAEMVTNLRDMYGGMPSEISRHLFEIYGNLRFCSGGFQIKCRCLEDNVETVLSLDKLDGKRYSFGKESIPAATDLTGKYYEPTDDDTFPAIDSLTAQGMFQFTVAVEHPIRGVQVLQKLCRLYSEPKLFFVVPNSRFEAFKKQKLQASKGAESVDEINELKQYVLCLEVK